MSFKNVMIKGINSYVKVDSGIHIHTYDSAYRDLLKITKPKKRVISESSSDGLPTWKVSVFSVYPWMFNSLLEEFPEFESQCKAIMSSISNKKDHVWPEYCANPNWFPYQKEGVEWLLANKGGMICDEMGLGKTIQAIGYMDNSPYSYVLIVSPASMIFTWKSEIEKWSNWSAVVLDGKKKMNKAMKEDLLSYEHRTAFVMSWSSIALHYEKISDWGSELDLMVCDESHYAKGIDAKRTNAVMLMSKLVDSTVLLSGTPMRNCAIDLFPQLHMVSPDEFPDFYEYSSRYSPPRERTFGRTTVLVYDQSTNLPELRQEVKSHMIFRKKKAVLKDLPSKIYGRIDIETPRSIKKDWKDIMDSVKAQGQIDSARMIAHRQEVGLAKATFVSEWLEDHSSVEKPVVVFIVHKDTRRLIEGFLKSKKISSESIVGGTSNKKRKSIIDRFQEGKIQVLICSEAGKEGITLTRASSLVQIERFWVPADEEQAEARIWRIGQKNPVIIYHAHMPGTIDDFIVGKLIRKRDTIAEVFSDSKIDNEAFLLMERAFQGLF